jgi:hypothetical protein
MASSTRILKSDFAEVSDEPELVEPPAGIAAQVARGMGWGWGDQVRDQRAAHSAGRHRLIPFRMVSPYLGGKAHQNISGLTQLKILSLFKKRICREVRFERTNNELAR